MRFLMFGLLFLTAIYVSESRFLDKGNTIKKVSGKFYEESAKDQLRPKVEEWKKKAQDAIKKLKAEGKNDLAEGIKKYETAIVDLYAQLEKLNQSTQLGKVLHIGILIVIKGAELEHEIKRVLGSYYDHTKDELKNSVENLKKEAKEAIQKLKTQDETAVAEGVKDFQELVVQLLNEYVTKNLNSQVD